MDSDPVTWMETHFYLADPRDPLTGDLLPAGPIRLAEHQRQIIRAAVERDAKGLFKWVTVLYSAPKKSGKTRVAAAMAAWYAATAGSFNEIYCIANDGKQSSDRILSAIKQSVKLSRAVGGLMGTWYVTKPKVTLPNETLIEAIPCDPTGQAGANPGLTVWSEMWGYRHEHKERLFTEMTVPPTRWGHAMRWVESYAGYSNESITLENLYKIGTEKSHKHPLFFYSDLPVRVNVPAKLFCYWDHEPRMAWQTPEYYTQERAILRTTEFDRIHRNMWIGAVEKAIQIEWWDACEDVVRDGVELPPLDDRTPIVVGLDASVSHDSCAAVAISRHPTNPRETAIRAYKAWEPPVGGKIDLTETIEKWIRNITMKWNVVEYAYDEYQLHKMCTDLTRSLGRRFRAFSQGQERAVADKQLYEMILQKQISHIGGALIRKHVDHASATQDGKNLRFIKPDRKQGHGITLHPIDLLVASSMANKECLRLNLG